MTVDRPCTPASYKGELRCPITLGFFVESNNPNPPGNGWRDLQRCVCVINKTGSFGGGKNSNSEPIKDIVSIFSDIFAYIYICSIHIIYHIHIIYIVVLTVTSRLCPMNGLRSRTLCASFSARKNPDSSK